MRFHLAFIGAFVGLAAFALPATAASPPPSLRLFAAGPRVTVMTQGALRAGLVDLGLWVTSVGGNFQVDVRRPNYGAWTASQVDSATGASLRAVPAGLVDPTNGLKRFLSVRFRDSSGRVAARLLATFCPNGESARVDDGGPSNPTYPGDCFSASSLPFVRGIVWGIDSGWAVPPALTTFLGIPPGVGGPGFPGVPPGVGGTAFPVVPPGGGVVFAPPGRPPCFRRQRLPPGGINLKPGRYTAIVSITAPYQQLFAVPTGQASVTLDVRVLPTRPVRCRPLGPRARAALDQASGPPAKQLAAPTVTQPDPATLPNLVALPAWGIGIYRTGRRTARRSVLSFNATIWDAGPAPFSIEGFRRPNSNLMDAYEYFFDSSGNVVGRAPAGTLYYDNGRGHHHWHLRQLASYDLVGPTGHVVRSQKQSFCIAPTNAVDLTVPGAALTGGGFGGFGFGFGGSMCDSYSPSAIWLREQLPAGWGDTYQQAVAGQAFDITDTPNGVYRIEVRVNPLGLLHETTTADDLAVRVIRLSGRRGARKVSVAPWHGIRG